MIRATTECTLNALWYDRRHAWLGVVLTPFERVYTQLAKRRWRRAAAQRVDSLAVPVVIVGNIVAGGSGKTPVTQALAIALKARGIKVGIVSRGYGGTVTQPTVVDATQPQQFGDEPCLLAATTGCPVAVARVRSEAVQLLHTQFDVDIVLSDDGMQHASLHRDFEICILGARGLGNRRGLPAGPLREPVSRLGKVDAVLTWAGESGLVPKSTPQWQIQGVHSPLQLLSGNAAQEGGLKSLAALQVKASAKTKLRLFAAAGLAQPDRFYVSLAGAGLNFKILNVPDHGMLTDAQLSGLPDDALLLVTEKDAVKLRHANISARAQRMVRIVPWRVTLPSALVDSVAELIAVPFLPSAVPADLPAVLLDNRDTVHES
jgi:tetraacyldisaccharide 4'-kinase